jgi:hypothetical protein
MKSNDRKGGKVGELRKVLNVTLVYSHRKLCSDLLLSSKLDNYSEWLNPSFSTCQQMSPAGTAQGRHFNLLFLRLSQHSPQTFFVSLNKKMFMDFCSLTIVWPSAVVLRKNHSFLADKSSNISTTIETCWFCDVIETYSSSVSFAFGVVKSPREIFLLFGGQKFYGAHRLIELEQLHTEEFQKNVFGPD